MSKGKLGPGDGCSLNSVDCDDYALKGQMHSPSSAPSSHSCNATSITADQVNSVHQSILSTSIVSTLASFTSTPSVTVAHSTTTSTSHIQEFLKHVVKTESTSPTKLQRLSCIALRAMEQPVSVVATSCTPSKASSASTKCMKDHLDTLMLNEKMRIFHENPSAYLFDGDYTAQVRTIFETACFMPERVRRGEQLIAYKGVIDLQSLFSQKMTLMAELFASEDDDEHNEETYPDDTDPIGVLTTSFEHTEHLAHENEVEYEDEEEGEEEDQDDDGEDGDDENSEIESFTLEDDPLLENKYMLEIESHAIDLSENEHIGTTFPVESTRPVQLARVPKDSLLYRKLQLVTSDVHTVIDEVGETISKMRIRGDKTADATRDLPHVPSTNTTSKNLSTSSSLPSKLLRAVRTAPDSSQKSGLPFPFKALSRNDPEFVEKFNQLNPTGNADPADHTAEMFQRKDVDKFLAYAAGIGAMDMVKFLLTSPLINLNKCSGKEMTPLMESASNGHLDIVELLVEHGADVNFKSKQNNTALMFASAMGHLPIVKFLVSRGADIEAQNENGHTALMEAASAGHVEVVTQLVSQGANINVHSNEYKETALTLAAYKGHTKMVRYLLQVGAGQLHRGEEMHTALMEASMDGHVEVARLLLDSGAQVNMPPDSFESPLTLAACGGHVELASLLLQRGANIEEVNDEGYTALMEAAREGHEEMVKLLISHGAKVNATTEESKETALLMACAGGATEVINILINAGADIELGSNTPLIEAAQEGHLEIVKTLLNAQAKVNATNSSGETALTLASENGHHEIVKLLLASGAQVDFCAEGGKTALMKAAQAGRVEVVSLLIDAKADVNRISANNEYTPLSLACFNGRDKVVEVLLEKGADPNHRLKDNSTVFIEAAKNGHVNVVQVLIDYGQFPTGCAQSMLTDNQAPSLPKRPTSQSTPVSSGSQATKSAQASNPPRVKMQKKMPPSPPTLIAPAPPQPVPSHIKLVGNPTLKVYPKPPASKKCSSYRKLYIPNCKKVASPQVNIKHMMHQGNINTINKTDSPLPVANKAKSNRSSDSLSSDSKMEAHGLITLQLKPFPSPLPASYGKPSRLAEHFMEQVSTIGPENSDLAGEIAAAFFYSIFHSFLKPHYKPSFTDDQLFGHLIEDIWEIIHSNLVDNVAGEWLDMRLKMIEVFQHFCEGRKRTSEKLATDSSDTDSQMDVVVPGWVLKKLCHNSKITEKFCMQNIGLFDLCRMFKISTRNPYGVLGISDDLVEEMKLLDLLSTPVKFENANMSNIGCQTVSRDKELTKRGEILPRNADKATSVDQFAFNFENPEQAIFAVKNGTVFPLEYADDALFDIFIKAVDFFMSPEKDTLLDDILKDLGKSPPNLQATMRPLFSQIQQKMQSVFIKSVESGQGVCENSNNITANEDATTTLLPENGTTPSDCQPSDQDSSQTNPNMGHPSLSAFSIIRKPFEVASVMPDYPGDWSSIEPLKFADKTQVIELNSTKFVNAINSANLSQEKLLAFRNQVVAATLFISYTTDVCTEDMLRGHLSRATPIFSPTNIANPNMSEKTTQATNELGFNPTADTLLDLLNTFAPVMQDERFAFFREKLSQLGLNDFDQSANQDSELTEANIFELPGSAAQLGIPQVLFPHEVLPGNSTAFTEFMSNATPSFVPFPTEFNFTLSNKTEINCAENSQPPHPLTSKDVEYINKCYKNFFSSKGVSKLKCAPSSSSPILLPTVQIQPTAATVSINTNTTSTPTTAVCVGTLMPQLPLPDSVTQFKPPTSATMQKLIQTTNFSPITTTTKSITKLKNSVSQSSKNAEAGTQDPPPLPAAIQHMHNPPAQRSLLKARTTTTQTQSTTSKVKTSAPIDLNSQTDSNHDTALTVTCASGHEEMVNLLIQQGADIEHRDKKGHTPLMIAAINGFHKIVDLLANNGADLEAQTERTKDTALSLACSSGRYDVVEVLLLRGSNKEHRNVSDYTPLSLAASGGFVNVINLLLNSGAEINSRTGSKLGISPLMLAAMNGHTETVRLLLDKGSDINAYIETNKNTALTLACFQGRTEVVSLLLDRNANIEHRAKTGLTPLMEAASGGFVDVGRVLLDKGGEVNAAPVPASRDTALTIAADKGHATFVELLVKRGAIVDVKNKKGYSPLWLACNGGHFEVANLLVNAKCDVDSQDNRKISCLMAAFRKGHVKLVKFMVRHVTQFPSEQEINRFMSICTDEEIKKKVMICSGIIRFAKDRQAQEANKNAANLLEEIDAERSREENRKAAAARRRERRKQKKKEKAEGGRPCEDDKIDDDIGDTNGVKLSSGNVEGDYCDEEDTTAYTIDDDDYDSFDELGKDDDLQPTPPSVAPQDSKKNKKKKKSKSTVEVLEVDAPQSQPVENRNKKKDKKNKNKSQSSTTNAISTKTNKEVEENATTQEQDRHVSTKLKSEDDPAIETAKAKPSEGDPDDASGEEATVNNTNKVQAVSIRSKTSTVKKSDNSSAMSATIVVSSNGTSQVKREEGWKEVSGKKSKKVLVPANAISRVIGRAGCNINTIREVSGAHIEVEKQKGQGDRMVVIRGSADATRNAHQLITQLSKEADKELSEIIRQLGLSKTCLPPTVTVTTSSTTTSITTSSSNNENGVDKQASKQLSSTARVSTASKTNNSPTIGAGAMATKSGTSKPTTSGTSDQAKSSYPSSSNSNTSNTVSYTMAVNAKTRSTKSPMMSNGVKIMSAVYKPSNKAQSQANGHHSTRTFQASNKCNDSPSESSYKSPSSASKVPSDSESIKSETHSVSSLKTEVNSEFNFLNNVWPKQLACEKLNFASVAASGVSSISQSTSTSSINSKQNMEISVDEAKAPGYNRHFASPGSFSASSTSSYGPTLSINTATNSMGTLPQHAFSSLGNTRSAPCTPPMANCSPGPKFHSQQQSPGQISELSSPGTSDLMMPSKSQLMDSNFLSNPSGDFSSSIFQSPLLLGNSSNNLQSDIFYANSMSADEQTLKNSNNQNIFNSSNSGFARSASNYMDINSPNAMFGGSDQHLLKSSLRSSLNPNAPDFASRSNSFPTNTLQQQPMLNLSQTVNSSSAGSNSSIASTGFGNVPPRPNYLPTTAPPISSTAVRAAIVNYSINVFGNQVPQKQHQEAAARLAHLSAQSSGFVNNDYVNAFMPNTSSATNNGNINQDKMKMYSSYNMYNNQQTQFKAHANSNGAINVGLPSPFGGSARNLSNNPVGYNSSTESITTAGNLGNSTNETIISNEDRVAIQRNIKLPAPIGTERAQKKNPANMASPLQNATSNLAAFDQPLLNNWTMNSSNELAAPSDGLLSGNRGLSSFGSSLVANDFNDFLVYNNENSLPGFSQGNQHCYPLSQRTQIPPVAPIQSRLNFIDGFGPSLDNSNSISNFKGLSNPTNNSIFGANFNHTAPNQDSEYWSANSPASVAKPTLSNNSTFDSKIHWNNWNN